MNLRRPNRFSARCVAGLLCLAAVCTAYGRAHGQDRALEPVRLQLKWSHQFQFAGYYAAVARGFYAEAGFSVTLIESAPNQSPNAAVLAGEAEFGVAGSDLLLGYLDGDPLVVLAAIFQHSPYALLTLESSGILEPEDLAGKRVMLRSDLDSAEIYAMLGRAGVPRGQFEEVPLSFRHEDLLDGKADAMSVYLTDQPFLEGIPGAETILLRPAAFGVDFYGDCLFTTRELLESRRDRVEAFRSASLKGWQYAMDNPGEIIAWIEQHYPGRRTSAQLHNEAVQMQSLILPQLVPLGQMNPERWERILEDYRDVGMAESGADLGDFIYRERVSFDPAALRRLLWYLVPAAAIVASWIAFLMFFNRRLATAVHDRTAALEQLNRELAAESARRGEAEVAFRRGEEYHRSLVERLPVGLALSRMTGELVYVNEAYARTIGRSVEQTLDLTYWDITPEAYREQEMALLDEVTTTGRFGPYEKEYIHADGHRVPVRLNGILLDRDGEAHMWACVEDITSVRDAERAARHRDEQYRTIFESIPLGLIISNADGSTADVNPAAHRMHGYTREEFLALEPPRFVHESSLPDFGRFLDEVLAGKDFHVIGKNVHRNGSIIDIEVTGVQFRHQGQLHVLGILQDITARVRTEEDLHQSEEKFRTIVETTKEWIWEIDLSGRHTYSNPALSAILGYATDKFLTMDTFALIHPDDRSRVEEALPMYIERGSGWENWVLRWLHQDGSYRFLESNAAPIRDRNGQLRGFRGVDRDITDRIESERMLSESMETLARHQEHLEALVRERTAALEQAQADLIRKERLATLGQLIGTVSHEIRNPLGTVRSSVFSIGQMLRRGDLNRIDVVLDRAERNIVRCDRIIEELLDFTRSRKLERQPTPIGAWLGEVLDDVPLGDGIQCVRHLGADGIANVDREHLRRAIINLVNNAVQAMESSEAPGRTLRVSTAHDGRGIEIAIADEGVGILPEHMDRIFEPLFSTKGFGVGLGIPVIKDIIEAHDGRLHYESAVGRGTTVRVWLPAA